MDVLKRLLLAVLVSCGSAQAQDTTTTSNMDLTLPVPLQRPGAQWASDINEAFTDVDAHDHTSGKGVSVPVSGLNLNADLDLTSTYRLDNALAVDLAIQVSVSCLATTVENRLINVSGDLYWCNEDGSSVRITDGTALSITSVGGIGGLPSGNAAVTYVTDTYVFIQDTNNYANIDAGSVTIHEDGVVGPEAIKIKSPASVVTGYDLTLPPAQAGSTSRLSITSGGVMTFVAPPDGTALPQKFARICATTQDGCDHVGTDETPFNDAMIALGSNGGTILVGEGTYTFTTTLSVSGGNYEFVGAGNVTTAITGALAGSVIDFVGSNNKLRNVLVRNTQASGITTAIKLSGDRNTVDGCIADNDQTSTTITDDSSAIWVSGNYNRVTNNRVQITTTGAASLQRAGVVIGNHSGVTGSVTSDGNLVENLIVDFVSSSGANGYGVLLSGRALSGQTVNIRHNTVKRVIPIAVGDADYCIGIWGPMDTGGTSSYQYNLLTENMCNIATWGVTDFLFDETGGTSAGVVQDIHWYGNPEASATFTGVSATTDVGYPKIGAQWTCDDSGCAGTSQIDGFNWN